jgi:hypothetical protein
MCGSTSTRKGAAVPQAGKHSISDLSKSKETEMKMVIRICLIVLCAGFICGCADLKVTQLSAVWDQNNKVASATISNTGNGNAGSFLVYFYGVERPISKLNRPQIAQEVDGLMKGEQIEIEADFDPLAHPNNNNLANVIRILVVADQTNKVGESNENNNTRAVPVP